MKSYKDIFLDGFIRNNPVMVQLIGLCSVLAITTTVENALGMGAAVIFVLTGSNIVVSALRKFIPKKVRIPSYIVIIATFVTIVEMVLNAYLPDLYDSLGIFIPLIVVNCIIFARAEIFASTNPIARAAVDGLATGLGYTLVVVILAAVRELFGSGTLMGIEIIPSEFNIGMFTSAPGAYVVLGIMIAIYNLLKKRSQNKKLLEEAARR